MILVFKIDLDTITLYRHNSKFRIDYSLNSVKDKKVAYKKSSIIFNPTFMETYEEKLRILNHESKTHSSLFVRFFRKKQKIEFFR